jgi:hypothetical protein
LKADESSLLKVNGIPKSDLCEFRIDTPLTSQAAVRVVSTLVLIAVISVAEIRGRGDIV